jgi:hypothetical protein
MTKEALRLALEALEVAQDNLRPHGDNCFLHDEGQYNRCFCGKDSLSDYLQEVVEKLDTAIKAALEANEGDMWKVDKLRVALMKANNQAEHFEREWYLRGDEIEQLKTALEAKDEPLAYLKPTAIPENACYNPPQRTWVGLTDEDLKLLSAEWRIVYGAWMDDFARDIEAKLKEKNT